MNIWLSKIFIMLVCLIFNNLIWHSQEINLKGMTTSGSLTSVLFCVCCWSYWFAWLTLNTARQAEALCFPRCENCSQTFWGICYFLQENINGGKPQMFAYSMYSSALVCRIRLPYVFLSEEIFSLWHFFLYIRNKIRVKVKNVVTIQANMKFHKYYGLCYSTSKIL